MIVDPAVTHRARDLHTGDLVTGRYYLYKDGRSPVRHVIDTGSAIHDVDKTTVVAYTGQTDKNNTPIFIGDRLKDQAGMVGTVVFIFGANRLSLDGYNGQFLFYNSSLLQGDHGGAERFEIVSDD